MLEPHAFNARKLSRRVTLDDIKEEITRRANAVHDAAERLIDDVDATWTRHQLERELDALFAELGVEVYQRMRRSDPVEDSVVIEDLVDRIAQVEARLPARGHDEGGEPSEAATP